MERPQKCLAAIRIRGTVGLRTSVKNTLRMLGLNYNCNATLLDDRESYKGMLNKVSNCVTWGEPSITSIERLLLERGRTQGNRKITEEKVRQLGYESIRKLAEALFNLKVELKDLEDIKPVFRLHPPRKGYKRTIKKTVSAGGASGYRGEAINELIERMA